MTSSFIERIIWGSDASVKHGKAIEPSKSHLVHKTNTSDLTCDVANKVDDSSHVSTDEKIRAEETSTFSLANPATGNTCLAAIRRLRPVAGIAALSVTVASVMASLVILLVSDGQQVNHWPIQPTVYLAIVAAVSRSSLALAHTRAVSIAWWYHASRGGSINALERHWRTTNSFMGAVTSGRHLNLLVLASIATSLVIIDGPFLQRASTVVPATVNTTVSLNLKLPPELPTGFSGMWKDHFLFFTLPAYNACTTWAKDEPISFKVPECEGTCHSTIHGPGFAKLNCSSHTWPITPAMTRDANATWGLWKIYGTNPDGTTYTSNPAFYVNIIRGRDGPGEAANLTVGLAKWKNFCGAYVQTSCSLVSAIVEYHVLFQDGRVNFDTSKPQGRLLHIANNTHLADTANQNKIQPTTIDHLTDWAATILNANASVTRTAPLGGYNASYAIDFSTANAMVMKHVNFSDTLYQDLSLIDPTDDIIFSLNRLMFRGSIFTASEWTGSIEKYLDPGVSANQTVQALQINQHIVFRTNLKWYAAATVVTLTAALLVLSMFWGWWQLCGNMTMSPFEIALAFDAPLLSEINSAAGARGVKRAIGDMQLRFGAVCEDGFTGEGDHSALVPGRLGIAEKENVVTSWKGARFTR